MSAGLTCPIITISCSNRRAAVSRVLVVTPTRELATQCHAMTEQLAKHTDVRAALIVGGLSMQVNSRLWEWCCSLALFAEAHTCVAVGVCLMVMQTQEVALRGRPDIIICTPGRLIDHLRNSQSVHLEVCCRCHVLTSEEHVRCSKRLVLYGGALCDVWCMVYCMVWCIVWCRMLRC